MNSSLLEIQRGLALLSVFRTLSNDPLLRSLSELLSRLETKNKEANETEEAEETKIQNLLSAYGAFCAAVYDAGGHLANAVEQMVLESENACLRTALRGQNLSDALLSAAKRDLALLERIAVLTPEDFSEVSRIADFHETLPGWSTSSKNISRPFFTMLSNLESTGYGIFRSGRVFRIREDGSLSPLDHRRILPISSLYGYERERRLVLDNTRALAEGGNPAHVLLYGDAGTGKSTTIKACAAEFFDRGLRLIELKKHQLHFLPDIAEQLSQSPLRFILFLDDLSFREEDDDFCFLKSLLEGDVAGEADNIRVYASSNRRHLIRESFDARTGNEIHQNDTLQESMSLADRFGLTVTFSKPEKDLYQQIVRNLANEYALPLGEKELLLKAEAFAIRAGGRSPRTAKQFVRALTISHAAHTPDTAAPVDTTHAADTALID